MKSARASGRTKAQPAVTAFAGDELAVRMRCENFGTTQDWLTRTKADVAFAFFGYNESFAGLAGLGKFKQDLGQFIQDTRQLKSPA